MKYISSILLILLSQIAISQNDCARDTLYYKSGQIEMVFGYDTTSHEYCGIYISYDSSGVKMSEGEYQRVDSVECFQCYNDTYRNSPEKWEQYFIAKHVKKIPVGEWKYYHNNGELKEVGGFCNIVHEYLGMSYPLEWEGKTWPEPVAGYRTSTFLKDGVWDYYDINGNNIRTEEYVRGQLVYLIERD